MITLTVVTPWRNHRELERGYWQAIQVCTGLRTLIVDDGSTPALPNAWRLDEHLGFSHACNTGLKLCRSDAVLFLNNDVQATMPHWDIPIREALEPGVLVGACLRHDPHGAVAGQPLPYLDGWCLAGMRDDLLELGGFDESYEEPAYYSDNDLCLRARAAGMTLREVKTGLVHLENVTAGPATDRRVREATMANRARFNRVAEDLLGVTA